MSKITSVAATSHNLSVTALEEASRFGARTADIDHLFLALVVNEQLAGQVLRTLGITLDAAREAVAAQHAAQLASLGIHAETPPGKMTPIWEGEGYEWGPRALTIIKHSAEGKKRGDAAAVLREILAEPSGLIEEILQRLDTTSDAVRARLDEAERYPSRPQYTFEAGGISGSSESFVPASIGEVWDLLADPLRMPEWETMTGSVEGILDRPEVGSTWTARPRVSEKNGTPTRIKAGFESISIDLLAEEHQHRIEWRFRWPNAAKANARRVRIELEPAAGGTQLHIRLAWERNPARAGRPVNRVKMRLMRPLHRFAVWLDLTRLGAGISRAFR